MNPPNPTLGGLTEAPVLHPVQLDRHRALGRTTPEALPLTELLEPLQHDLGWREHLVDEARGVHLQWSQEVPGLYALSEPALTPGVQHQWVECDLVVDARFGPTWMVSPRGEAVVLLALHGTEVSVGLASKDHWSLPRPPWEAWRLDDQPAYLRHRTARDAEGGLLQRALAVARPLRLWAREGAGPQAMAHDPTEGLRRWWAQVPDWLAARVEQEALQASEQLGEGAIPTPQTLLLRDDLQCLHWLLSLDHRNAHALTRRLASIDQRAAVPGAADLDPQLDEASWRDPDAWWASP